MSTSEDGPQPSQLTSTTVMDVLSIAIVCYCVLIEQEERRSTPDADLIAGWDAEIGRIAGVRRGLTELGDDQLHLVAAEHTALVRRLDSMIKDS